MIFDLSVCELNLRLAVNFLEKKLIVTSLLTLFEPISDFIFILFFYVMSGNVICTTIIDNMMFSFQVCAYGIY